jgi:hypothetical protein
MRYLLPCECGRKLPVSASQAGDTLTCECGRSVTAPKLRDLRQLEPTADAEPAPRRRLTWSYSQGMLFSTGLVLALLASVVLLVTTLQGSHLITEKPGIDPALLDEYLAEIDRNTPVQNFEVWQTEVLQEGLQREEEPFYVAHRRIAQMLRIIQIIVGIVGAAGLGMIAASFLARSKPGQAPDKFAKPSKRLA